MQQLTIQDLFIQSRAGWLEDARVAARRLLQDRYHITIEDVLRVCPRPTYLNRNVTGGVFQHPDFTPIGFVFSTRPISHGRVVRMWKLKPEVLPPPDVDDDEPEKEWDHE